MVNTFLKVNANEVIFAVDYKLKRIGKFRIADNIYENVGKIKEEVDSYIEVDLIEIAHNLINCIIDTEKHKLLDDYLISRVQQGAYD